LRAVSAPAESLSVTRIPSGEAAAYGPVGRSAWLDVDWRSHQHWVNVAGNPVNTVEIGSGPPIVFIHGLSGCWPNWLEQIGALSASHRVIAMDLPGFGHSPMPAEPISMEGYARTLDGLLTELGVGPAALVGNSMGGLIASEIAISFPARVRHLVLVSPAGISTQRESMASGRAFSAMMGLERALATGGGFLAARSDAVARHRRLREAGLRLVVAHPSALPPSIASELVRGAGKPGFMPALRSMLGHDLRSRLGLVACPALVVWGGSDRALPVRDGEVFTRLIPDAREVIFEDTGHLSMLERPAAFNAVLGEFLG
jgi:pimeloyl-ACP methyl ester carboxylesterase